MSEQSSVYDDVPRGVDLAITRVDAWMVMKVSFLLSVALGIATVIGTAVLWFMVDRMHVFSMVGEFLKTIGAQKFTSLLGCLCLPRVLSYATIVAISNVVLLVATATLGAMLYNIIASLVGGIKVSLMDERGARPPLARLEVGCAPGRASRLDAELRSVTWHAAPS